MSDDLEVYWSGSRKHTYLGALRYEPTTGQPVPVYRERHLSGAIRSDLPVLRGPRPRRKIVTQPKDSLAQRILDCLTTQGPQTLGQVSAGLKVDPSRACTSIRRLVQKGLVEQSLPVSRPMGRPSRVYAVLKEDLLSGLEETRR